ncbi:MAG: SRPBCC family protein [Jatrophihabitans sp.]
MPVAHWGYTFEPAEDGGCTVTESWVDRRPAAARPLLDALFGAKRADLNARGMATTLANLKRCAEAG